MGGRSRQRTIRVLDVVVTDDTTVTVRFVPSRALRRYFFKTTMSVAYDRPVDGLPDGVLVIPFLSLVMPVAWVLRASVEVPGVDATFAAALERVRAAFQAMYPEVPFQGELLASERTAFAGPATGRNGTLFSGGVDSMASAIRHREEAPVLFSVIPDRDAQKGFARWIKDRNAEFARLMGVDGHVVRADLERVFDAQLVAARHKEHIHEWWGGVQHGLFFAGVCAPLAAQLGIERFYIPSTHSVGCESIRWGSHPRIDNEIAWGKTRVFHDLYEIGRQGKVALIADYLAASGKRPTVCVCEMRKDVGGENCSRCEKCCRTMIGLAFEGIDPNELGFRMDCKTVARIRRRVAEGSMIHTDNEVVFWTELQRAADPAKALPAYGTPAFAAWLRGVDIKVTGKTARRLALYRKFVHLSAILPGFVRRPLRRLVLRIRGVRS